MPEEHEEDSDAHDEDLDDEDDKEGREGLVEGEEEPLDGAMLAEDVPEADQVGEVDRITGNLYYHLKRSDFRNRAPVALCALDNNMTGSYKWGKSNSRRFSDMVFCIIVSGSVASL